MWKIDKILNLLKTGEWYSLQEVIDGCLLPESKVKLVLKFLNQFNFIEINDKEQKVRLRSQTFSFLNQIDELNNSAKSLNYRVLPRS